MTVLRYGHLRSRDIYDEKENKASDPVPQTEVEDDLAQDVTLEIRTLDI